MVITESNRIVKDLNFDKAYSVVLNKLQGWLEIAIAMLPNMVVALLVLLLFYIAARLVGRFVLSVTEKASQNHALNKLFEKLSFLIVMAIGIFVSLSVLQLSKAVTSLLAGAGIVGLAVGFAFQDSAANFISGVFMTVRKPMAIGDIVESNDIMGMIEKINLRNTVIRTFQGQQVFVPNKEVYQNILINYSSSGKRRIDLQVGVSYASDLEAVKTLTIETVRKIKGVNQEDPVDLYYEDFGGSSIDFIIQFWIDYPDQPGFLECRSNAIIAIKKAYDQNDITIPFPIRTLDFGVEGGQKLSELYPLERLTVGGKD